MTPKYPDDCFQALVDSWWVSDGGKDVCRGRLIEAFVPHVDQVPAALKPIGRTDDKEHQLADCEIVNVDISQHFERKTLPVAGLVCYDGEVRTVYRAKKRPMVLIALAGQEVPKSLTKDKPKYQTSSTHLAIPYYGGNADGKRAGFKPEFLSRLRKCEFPQFSWDILPKDEAEESVLRLDHIQPISTHYKSFRSLGYQLSEDALMIMDEWITWHVFDDLPEDSLLAFLREQLMNLK
ncbi:MAG: hypothetical protein U5L00_01260 [Desulfovermiculus sp.]|nr:hypothetical protein [Desulfovermiculus sp.]